MKLLEGIASQAMKADFLTTDLDKPDESQSRYGHAYGSSLEETPWEV